MFFRRPHTPRRLRRKGKSALNVLLMSVPPLFNLFLVSFLSYYTVYLNNDSVNFALIAVFVDAQLLLNWIQFLRHQAIIQPSKRTFPGKSNFIDFPMSAIKKRKQQQSCLDLSSKMKFYDLVSRGFASIMLFDFKREQLLLQKVCSSPTFPKVLQLT